MFSAPLRDGFELRLLEERHAPALFKVVEREREHLREWLPWVDATKCEDDSLSFIRSVLEQFVTNHGFAAGIWNGDRLLAGARVSRPGCDDRCLPRNRYLRVPRVGSEPGGDSLRGGKYEELRDSAKAWIYA